MRYSMIVACWLVVWSSPALACYPEEAEATGGSLNGSMPRRMFADEGAEAASMLGASLVAAGSAASALVLVSFRILCRARGRGRARSVAFEPAEPEGPSSPSPRPGEAWLRVDEGHEWPGPIRAGEGEEALSGGLASS